MLAQAFADDPLVVAICDADPPEREERMRWSFRVAVRSHWLAEQPAWVVSDTTGALLGAVLVSRPRTGPPQALSDLFFTTRAFWHIGARTMLRGFTAARSIAEHTPPGPFTYLRTLGVHPAVHGRGLGSRLVEQVLRAATPSLPVYLETAKEQNLSFYARHGFNCIGQFSCLGVAVWRLLRPVS